MSVQLLDGRKFAADLQSALRDECARLHAKPMLAVLQLGDAPATHLFAEAQRKLGAKLGISTHFVHLPDTASQAQVEAEIVKLNSDASVHGIFVQNPLPRQIDAQRISALIDPEKDVEGITPHHMARRFFAKARIGSCTALAVMALIESTGEALRGKEAVVVGNSEIVGRPVSMLLLDQLATVTICHIATNERGKLAEHVERAEVLVVAVGKAGIIKGSWVKPGAIVIDVGINVVNGHTVGDVEFDEASKRAKWITPVPGGVGPVTVTMVMKNTLEAFKQQRAHG